ncbi:MAG TPA: extracellular solute-binding protein [Acetobacteraceae bacterium]|nr:extracellular solute-binding protein [Acetobacteraceae bacterium]
MRTIIPLLLIGLTSLSALADEGPVTRSSAIAILAKPALPPDFPYFPYVNPNAPKGGEVTLAAIGTYDSFNPFILRGTTTRGMVSPWVVLPGGSGSGSSVGHIWESLLTSSADEISTGYGHIAETIELPADKLWVGFELRPEAKFSDGTPITAEDVAWTYRTLLEQGRPSFRIEMADVKDVVVEGPRRVVFHFKSNENRELPLILGGLPVLPKHFFDGRDFTKPLTDPPIGSGPYRIADFELGRSVTYERRPDWWAADRPTGKGTNNFDRVHIEYFRDATVAMEAFKAGQIDLRSENISKNWATAYDFPAVASGLVIKREFAHHLPTGMQGYAMNTRRPVFANPLVRQAMAETFDFEWANKNLFYGSYARTLSYFNNSPLASSGIPQGDELKLLEPYRKELPPALFTEPFKLPVTDGSGNNREQLRHALDLLQQAGWSVKERKLVDQNGEQMSFTILLDEPSLERPALPYVQLLQKLGIDARVRTVDPAQYQHLTDDFDFDMIMMIYPEGDLPGNELRNYFTCAAAKAQGSFNAPGICQQAVDALVERIVTAQDRETLTTAARALDRVLLWGWYLVPNWDSRTFRIAYWDRFGHPDKPIREGFNFDTWWVDPAKAAATDAARSQ